MAHTLDLTKIDEVYAAIELELHRLSKWEQDFIESTKDQWDREAWLSEGQLEHLEKIYIKV